MKNILLLIGSIIIFALIFLCLETSLRESDIYKSKIGTQIVLYSDTLMIVDYSLLNENYTLSNNNKVSFELIEALPIIN